MNQPRGAAWLMLQNGIASGMLAVKGKNTLTLMSRHI